MGGHTTPFPRPQGVLFDLGDTIVQLEHDLQAGILRFLELIEPSVGIDYDLSRKVGDSMALSSEAVRLGSNYEVSFEAFHRNWCDRFGVKPLLSWPEIDLEYFKASHRFVPEDGVRDMLETLTGLGIRIGAVSNSFHTGSSLEWQLERFDLLKYFQFVISSADYGFRKPHPEIFETAIARLGLKRENIWFVGDKPGLDIVGARGVGLTAVWYNADNEPPCQPEPDLTVRSWKEFESIISSLVR
jgi:putative hydrolase of the HAD superfamily